jgi:hypothetical protein
MDFIGMNMRKSRAAGEQILDGRNRSPAAEKMRAKGLSGVFKS